MATPAELRRSHIVDGDDDAFTDESGSYPDESSSHEASRHVPLEEMCAYDSDVQAVLSVSRPSAHILPPPVPKNNDIVVGSFHDFVAKMPVLAQNTRVNIWWSPDPVACDLRDYCIMVPLPGGCVDGTFVMACADALDMLYIASSPSCDEDVAFTHPRCILKEIPGTYFRKVRLPKCDLDTADISMDNGVMTIKIKCGAAALPSTVQRDALSHNGRRFLAVYPPSSSQAPRPPSPPSPPPGLHGAAIYDCSYEGFLLV